jgi:hypothetical protein
MLEPRFFEQLNFVRGRYPSQLAPNVSIEDDYGIPKVLQAGIIYRGSQSKGTIRDHQNDLPMEEGGEGPGKGS